MFRTLKAAMFMLPLCSFSFFNIALAGKIKAVVNVEQQIMTVMQDGEPLYQWKVSTGRDGYLTPTGVYKPERMYKMWHSRTYNNSPMPYAIFYDRGYAIHGTESTWRLGSPASHGCVRLDTKNAKLLYNMVKEAGSENLEIVILDTSF